MELQIWNNKNEVIGITQVDPDVYEKYRHIKWRNSSGYAIGTILYKTPVRLHRLIVNAPKGMEVDHIDGNPLNNCRSNLRLCTRTENAKNRRKSKHGKVPYKGVRHNTTDGRNRGYTARISLKGKYLDLGTYETAEEAARVYDTAARTHYGEFARLNFPEGTIQGFLPTAKKRIKTSQYRGVQKRNLFWRAILVREGKNVHLGDCESEEAAARLYDQAVIEHYGTDDPRMKLNFPLDL